MRKDPVLRPFLTLFGDFPRMKICPKKTDCHFKSSYGPLICCQIFYKTNEEILSNICYRKTDG